MHLPTKIKKEFFQIRMKKMVIFKKYKIKIQKMILFKVKLSQPQTKFLALNYKTTATQLENKNPSKLIQIK